MQLLGDLRDPRAFSGPLKLDPSDRGDALKMLHVMKLIRGVEEEIGRLVETQEARCPCHLAIGQEAAAVGVCSLLRPSDAVFGAHRSHGHFLALGGTPRQLFAEVLGKQDGCSGGFGGSMHLRSPDHGLVGTVPIVGATIPIAVGAGLAARHKGDGAVAVAFFGDGAAEEGVFHESLNLAASMSLPVVFVVENNLFASHLHIDERQPSDRVARYADSHRMESISMDGNDVIAIRNALSGPLTDIRRSPRPMLLELVTYRWRGHVGHREDMDVGVARSGDLPAWKGRDPIQRLEHGLVALDGEIRTEIEHIDTMVTSEVGEALAFGRASLFPQIESLRKTVMYLDQFE